MHRFIDLFCGIGGFRVALEKEGFDCVFSSEIDKHASEVYYKNFRERPEGDIRNIPEKEIPPHDILCAGFPCQSFSISGNLQGTQDARGKLFYEILRIAEYHQPYILMLENVKNIVSIDQGKTLKTMEVKLNDIGYEVNKHVLNASHFGVPQKRERIYFVCIRQDAYLTSLKYNKPTESFKKIYLEDILEEKVAPKLYIQRKDIVLNEMADISNNLKPIRIGIVNKGGQGERIYSPKGHAITLSAHGGGVGAKTGLYLDHKGIRRLSLTEGKRAMGFLDSHIISLGTQGYKQLGNAVIPSMINHVYGSIKSIK